MPMGYDLLERDHARARDCLAEIWEAAGVSKENTAEKAIRVFAVVRKEPEIHMAFEEEAFYPVVRDTIGLHDAIDRGWEEHNEVLSFLDEQDRLQPGSDDWTESVEDLAAVLDNYCRDEEGALLPASRACLDTWVVEMLGRDCARMRDQKRLLAIEHSPGVGETTVKGRRS